MMPVYNFEYNEFDCNALLCANTSGIFDAAIVLYDKSTHTCIIYHIK